ncbi:MAG: SWIM zinc finger family protein, partial [Anaerolineae bacterium]
MSDPMPDGGGTVAGNPFSAALLARFSESALAQAKNYLIIGGVFDGELTVTPDAQFLQANVRRSTARHYHVTIQANARGEVNWLCTCPFAAQNCEHTAAVLRVWLQEPQRFTISHDDAPIYLPAAAPMAVTVTPPAAPVAAPASVPA